MTTAITETNRIVQFQGLNEEEGGDELYCPFCSHPIMVKSDDDDDLLSVLTGAPCKHVHAVYVEDDFVYVRAGSVGI